MSYTVVWSDFSEKMLDEIFAYYEKHAHVSVASEIVLGIISEPNLLINNPFIGQKEPLLKERKIEYRYLIHNHYKIIYAVDGTKKLIKISDVFDTRQYPEKIKRKK